MLVDDLTNVFCAACQLFQIICDKYHEILAFNDWNKFL